MPTMEFEWDTSKAVSNLRKHGVSFEDASKAFDDPIAVTLPDDCDFEERTILIGRVDSSFLFVVFTERPPNKRLISARRATKHEQDTYYHENFS